MENNWFMGACANPNCSGDGGKTSVRFREHQNNFFCWRCESDDEYHLARTTVTPVVPKLAMEYLMRP